MTSWSAFGCSGCARMAKGQEGDNGEQQRLSQVDPAAASSSLRLGEAGGGLSKRMSLNRPCWRSGESPFVPSGSRAFVPNHHHPFPLSFASKAYLLYSKTCPTTSRTRARSSRSPSSEQQSPSAALSRFVRMLITLFAIVCARVCRPHPATSKSSPCARVVVSSRSTDVDSTLVAQPTTPTTTLRSTRASRRASSEVASPAPPSSTPSSSRSL